MNDEIYYLSSLDSARFAPVRECLFVRRLRFTTGKECALVRLNPAVIMQDFDLGTDIEEFILTNRHEGEGLSPIREFPCFVFLARLLVGDIENRDTIGKDEVEIIGWGELYRNMHDAEHHTFD